MLFSARYFYLRGYNLRVVLLAILAAVPVLAQEAALPSQHLIELNRAITASAAAGQLSAFTLRPALEERRKLLIGLFRNQPAEAGEYLLASPTRAAIVAADASLAPLVEQELTATGELAESIADDFEHGASFTFYRLHTRQRDIDLSFPQPVEAIERLLRRQVTVHGVALQDIALVKSFVPASAEEIEECAAAAPLAVAPQTGGAPAVCSTMGTQRVAALWVTFPNNNPGYNPAIDVKSYMQGLLFGANPSVAGYWSEVSYGQTTASGDVFGPFALSQAYDCNSTTAMMNAAFAAAAGSVDFSQYNRYAIVFPATDCWFGGLSFGTCGAATTQIPQQYSVVFLPVIDWYTTTNPLMWANASHELGHSLGVNHANTLNFGAQSLGPLDFTATNPGTVSGSPPAENATPEAAIVSAVNMEYGDPFSLMGNAWSFGGPYSAEHRVQRLGWIPRSDLREVTASGSFTLTPAEDASGLRALRILRDPASASWLWAEFHQPIGFYTPYNVNGNPGDTVTTGALIHYEESTFGKEGYTYLLDMSPTTASNNFLDSTLAPGSSWSDPYSLLTLKAGTQSSSGLLITVSYDAPCAAVSLSATELSAAGGAANVNISAPSACSWSVSSNAPWISFPGATSGSGSATIAFNYSANTDSTQRDSYITAQRQSLPIVQDGPGATVLGVTPAQGSGSAQTFVIQLVDSAGASALAGSSFAFDIGGGGSSGGYYGKCYIYIPFESPGPIFQGVSLAANPGTGGGGWLPAGSTGLVSNGYCTVYAAGSTVAVNGSQIQISLNVSFFSSMLGSQSLRGWLSSSQVFPLGLYVVTNAPAIVSPASATFTVSTANSFTVTASGSPAPTFSETGALPAGVTLSSAGVLSGSPAVAAIGSYPIVIKASNGNAPDATQNFTLTVSQVQPKITWNPLPNSIMYGTALGAQQLNASASVPGSFSYNPPVGTILNAGTQTLSATFTPTDSSYATVTVSTQVTVTKAFLSVIIQNQEAAAGQPIPTLVGWVFGVINNDGITAVFSTTAVQGAPAGEYPITATLNDPKTRLPNYNVTVSGGTLFIYSTSFPVPFWLGQSSATAGAGQMNLVVNGANFSNSSVVLWNGMVHGATTVISTNVLSVVVPASDLVTEGTALITVADKVPTPSTSVALPFLVMKSSPVAAIRSASLSSAADGSGNRVLTLNGSNFLGNSIIKVNGTAVATTYVNPWQLAATIGSSISAGSPVTVQNTSGSSVAFTLP